MRFEAGECGGQVLATVKDTVKDNSPRVDMERDRHPSFEPDDSKPYVEVITARSTLREERKSSVKNLNPFDIGQSALLAGTLGDERIESYDVVASFR